MQDIAIALWFFLPAGAANMAPIFAAAMPGLRTYNRPIDGGAMFRGKRMLGKNKTWRGLAAGVIAATGVLWLQVILVEHIGPLRGLMAPLHYEHLPVLILGPLFGLGALGGDALKSFFKRQIGIAPGQSWFPFDQIDYVVGGAIAAAIVVRLTAIQYAWVVVVWVALHVAVSYIGYRLRLKERPI